MVTYTILLAYSKQLGLPLRRSRLLEPISPSQSPLTFWISGSYAAWVSRAAQVAQVAETETPEVAENAGRSAIL